jgi:hypothetical protein
LHGSGNLKGEDNGSGILDDSTATGTQHYQAAHKWSNDDDGLGNAAS